MEQKKFDFSVNEEYKNYTPNEVLQRISKKMWKEIPYKAQNWGIWLHHMGAYVGKIKPAMAYFLIKSSTKSREVIFDPFCGI